MFGFNRLIYIAITAVPILLVLASRFTFVLVGLLIGLLVWCFVGLIKLYKMRLKTLKGLKFEELILDTKNQLPIIVFSRKPLFRKRRFRRVRLAYVRLPDPRSSIYEAAVKLLRDSLEKAKRIEVDYRLSQNLDNGLTFGHVYVDDAFLNYECMKEGRMELTRLERARGVPFRMKWANKKAIKKKLGSYSLDPSIVRTYLESKEKCGGVDLLPPPLLGN
jgi:hypothetical protein